MELLQNRYQVKGAIAQGGMGKIYLAIDIQTNKRVAVKEFNVPKSDKRRVERIQREYYFITKISHPNLVRGLDYFQVQNRHFIVTNYIEGMTLQQLICEYPRTIDFRKQLEIARRICVAVAALNKNGIVHRDIKPSNILLSQPDWKPTIIDLGVAKATDIKMSPITKAQKIVGSPDYMSPEQIDGTIAKNSDVFALGIVFYQFFSWSPHSPFHGNSTISTLDNIYHVQLPTLKSTETDSVFEQVAAALDQALEKKPENRLSSAEKMSKLLSFPDSDNLDELYTSSIATQVSNNLLYFIASTLAVVLVLIFLVISSLFGGNDAQFYFTRAELLQKKKKYDLAEENYSKAIEINPLYTEAYFHRAVIRTHQEKREAAVSDYSTLIEVDPHYAKAYLNRGAIYHKQKKYLLAEQDYTKHIELRPQYSKVYILRANLYREQNKYAPAEKDYSRAIALDPEDAYCVYERAIFYHAFKKFSLAESDYTTVLKREPSYNAYFNRAVLYYNMEKYELAKKDYQQCLEMKPSAQVYHLLGMLYSNTENYKMAIKSYTKAIELDPEYKGAYVNRGLIYFEQQKYLDQFFVQMKAQGVIRQRKRADNRAIKLAERDYTQALKIDPNLKEAFFARGMLRAKQKEYVLANRDYSKAIELDPNYIEAYLYRGKLYEKQNSFALAEQDYDKILTIDPSYWDAYARKGHVCNQQQKYSQAVQYFNKVIQHQPKEALLYYGRGWSHFKQEKYELAEKDYNQAIRINFEYSWCYARRGLLYYSQKRYKIALLDWKKAIQFGVPRRNLEHWIKKAKKLLNKKVK